MSPVNLKKIAFIFPGQGSQELGMGMSFYNSNAKAKELFDCADKYCDFDLIEFSTFAIR